MLNDEAAGRRWLAENLGCDAGVLERLTRFAAELRDESRHQNLVARESLETMWWRHIVDSAQLLHVSRETNPSGVWLDLGSGAGFPGLVVGIIAENRPVRLVESRRRRVEWLIRAVAALELNNVEVLGCPLEKVATFPAAVISARAFAPLPRLLRLAARFSTRETVWLLPKGEKARQEVAELARDLRSMFHVKPSVTHPGAGIIVGHGAVPPQPGARAC